MEELKFWQFLHKEKKLKRRELYTLLLEYSYLKGKGKYIPLDELVRKKELFEEKDWEKWRKYRKEVEKDQTSSYSPTPSDELPFQDFGPYRIKKLLGQGGMGLVFLAEHKLHRRQVALKVLRSDWIHSEEQIRRFRREIEAIAKLKHPHIVELYEAGEWQNLPYYSMEFISGPSLEELLEKHAITKNQGIEILEAVCRALSYAHSLGIIHRDIKPSNILLDPEGSPKLTDFSLAKVQAEPSVMTQTGELLGTVSYMSPEAARGDVRQIDARTDIFSIGVILFRLVTGTLPFQGKTSLEVLHQIQHHYPVLPTDVPQDLAKIILKTLEKNPKDRYQTADQLADDLRRFLEGEPISLNREKLWKKISHLLSQHSQKLFSPLLFFLFLLFLLGEYFYFQNLLKQERQKRKKAEQKAKILPLESNLKLLLSLGKTELAEKLLEDSSSLLQETYHYWKGFIFFEKKQWELALEHLKLALNKGVGKKDLFFKIGETLYHLKRYRESLVYLKKATPKSAKLFILFAKNHLALGKPFQALEVLQEAERLASQEERKHIKILQSEALFALGENQKALKILSFYKNQSIPRVWQLLARFYLKNRHYRRASFYLSKLYQASKEAEYRYFSTYHLGKLALFQEDWQRAAHFFEEAKKAQNTKEISLLLSQAYFPLGELKKAMEALEKASPKEEREKLHLIHLWILFGKKEKALKQLEKFSRPYPRWKYFLFFTRDMEKLEKEIKSYIQRYPREGNAYAFLGCLYWQQGKISQAWDTFRKVLASPSPPSFPFAWTYGALCLLALGKKNAAFDLLEQAEKHYFSPQNSALLFYRFGTFLERQRKWEKAALLYRYSLIWNPTFYRAHFRLALCLLKQNQEQKAISAFRKAILYQPFFTPPYRYLGKLYLEHGKWREAEEILSRGLDFSPEDGELTFLRAKLFFIKGEQAASRHWLSLAKKRGYSPFEIQLALQGKTPPKESLKKILFLKQSKQFSKALSLFQKYLFPHPKMWRLYGELWLEWGKSKLVSYSPSEEFFLRCLIQTGLAWTQASFLNPNHSNLLFRPDFLRAWRLARGNLPKEKLRLLVQKFSSSFPPWVRVAFWSWILLEKSFSSPKQKESLLKEAEEVLQELETLKKSSPFYWGMRSFILLEKGDLLEAKKAAQKALSLSPTFGFPHFVLAGCALYQKDFSKAFQELHQALDMGLELPEEFFLSHPLFRTLTNSPGWRALLVRVKRRSQ